MGDHFTSMAARGRLGGLTTAARYGGTATTAAARASYRKSFLVGHECAVCPPTILPADLPELERYRRGEYLRRAHFARLAARSAMSRKSA